MVGHPEVVPLHQNASPRDQGGIVTLGDRARELHPRDQRELTGHAVPRTGHHGVLEVDGRPLDLDQHVTLG